MHKEIFKSSLWMFGGNTLQQVLQFGVFILLARQLAPETFGYVALAAVAIEICGAIGAWGITNFLTQRRSITPQLTSHAFVAGVGIALVLCLCLCAGVGIYAWASEFSLVAQLILMMVPIVLFQSFGLVPEAILKRKMQFKWLALRNNLAALLGGGVALVMAFTGFGVYALVAQKLIALFVVSLTVWIGTLGEIRLYPIARYRMSVFASILREGFKISSHHLSSLVTMRLVDAIIGLYLGVAALGQFKIIFRIFELLTQLVITPLFVVSYAAFPKVADDRAELRKLSLQITDICLLLFVPMLIGLALTAQDWVPLLLSEKWNGITVPLQVLSVMCVAQVVTHFQSTLMLAFRLNSMMFYQSIARVFALTILCFIAAQISIEAVILAIALQLYGFMFFNIFMFNRYAGWKLRDDVKMILPSVFASLVMAGAVLALRPYTDGIVNPVASLALDAVIGIFVYALAHLICFPKHSFAMVQKARDIILKKDNIGVDAIEKPL